MSDPPVEQLAKLTLEQRMRAARRAVRRPGIGPEERLVMLSVTLWPQGRPRALAGRPIEPKPDALWRDERESMEGCLGCGETFTVRTPNRRFCTNACYQRWRRRRYQGAGIRLGGA